MELEERKALESLTAPTINNTEDKSEQKKTDVTDNPPASSNITKLDIFFLEFSIITHILDILIDINLIIQYHLSGDIQTFLWTVSFILIPSAINTIISMRMNREDEEEQRSNATKKRSVFSMLNGVITTIFIILFQMTFTLRCFKNLLYAFKSRKCKDQGDKVGQRRYFLKMLKGEEDIALLRVLECFIEAAPQQILQLAIFSKEFHETGKFGFMAIHQLVNISSSFILMAWSMANYQRSIRLTQHDKKNISIIGTVFLFLWHFFITVSRIACVCAVAIYSEIYILSACVFHWMGMTTWLITESKGVITFCRNRNAPPHTPVTVLERISSVLFSCVLGFVYIFIYFNPEESSTFYRHLFYYTICFIENIIASILIIMCLPSEIYTITIHHFISFACIIPFILGILSMIIYYSKFHPSMKNLHFSFMQHFRAKSVHSK